MEVSNDWRITDLLSRSRIDYAVRPFLGLVLHICRVLSIIVVYPSQGPSTTSTKVNESRLHTFVLITTGDGVTHIVNNAMLLDEQISKLTKLKELLDAGVLSEEEFAQEKAKVMAEPDIRHHQPEPAATAAPKSARETPLPYMADTSIGPANVDLSSGIVLPLGILAILLTLISAIFTGLSGTGYFDESDAYTYSLVSGICDFLAVAAELIMWICAFNKLSKMPEGRRLGRIPLWTYLYLGTSLLSEEALIADPMVDEPWVFILIVATFALGYVAFISLSKAYSGKMRTYSLVWMIGTIVSFIMAFLGADLISRIFDVVLYVLLMIALLEKRRLDLTNEQIQSLVQLKELKEQGILSQEEFEKEKDRIINGTVYHQGQSQEPQVEQATSDNRNKEIEYNSKPGSTTKRQEKSWFAKNWVIIASAYPFCRILIKLIRSLIRSYCSSY